jgi:hypothetical protein
VYDPNTKVYFIVQILKGYPVTFAKDNHTPWMHRYLYNEKMPPSIESCFTVSTLYSNMTSSNKTSVFRILCQSLSELKAAHLTNTVQEKLARTQALFLYQIISLFDGDITLRSNADQNMPLLQSWLDELCKVRENLRKPEDINNQNPPKSWEVGNCFSISFPLLTKKVLDTFGVSPANNRYSLRFPGLVEYNVQEE